MNKEIKIEKIIPELTRGDFQLRVRAFFVVDFGD